MKFSKLQYFVLVALLLPISVYAQVSQIVFTTDSQIVLPGSVSEPITIQAQDSLGESSQTPETIDLEFGSTSDTGEFLNASGKPAGKTMNKNTANRTFYYRDSTEGSFELKITAKGRTSGKEWSAMQTINISSNIANSKEEVLVKPKKEEKVTIPTLVATTSISSSAEVASMPVVQVPVSTVSEARAEIGEIIKETDEQIKPESNKKEIKKLGDQVATVMISEKMVDGDTAEEVIYESDKSDENGDSWWSKLWRFLSKLLF